MSASAARLLRRIRLAEDSFLELKRVVFSGGKVRGPRRATIADELAGFANARGGTLILGVDDRTKDVVGIPRERLEGVVRLVDEVCRDTVDPPLDVSVRCMELPDIDDVLRCIVAVEVDRSFFVHRSPGGYMRRAAGSTRQIPQHALIRSMQERSQAGLSWFDENIIGNATIDDLDRALVDRFRTPLTVDERGVLAEKLGLVREADDGLLAPTIAGVLLASASPERWLPNAFIQAVAYRGRSVAEAMSAANYQIDAFDCVGPLDRQIADACRFVAKNQSVSASKRIGRTDHPQYDMTAVFEAVVNAVAHRDYSVHGSKIRLRLFTDRLELYSPGRPPNGLKLNALAYRQASRNNTVSSLLARCPVPAGIPGLETTRTTLMDRRGEGVGVVLRYSQKHSGLVPTYELFDDAELRLTIFAATAEAGRGVL